MLFSPVVFPVNAESCNELNSLQNAGRDECRRSLFENNSPAGYLAAHLESHLPDQLNTDLKPENSREGTSWKLCTLKCGLTIISSLCLLAFLVYNVISNIIDKVEFWDSLNKYQDIKNYNTANKFDEILLKNISITVEKILEEIVKKNKAN